MVQHKNATESRKKFRKRLYLMELRDVMVESHFTRETITIW